MRRNFKINMEKPDITVLMSIYKEPLQWLKECLDSILNQTFKKFELLVICDNPQYVEALDLIQNYKFKDNRIKLLINDHNIGLTKTLNKGIQVSNGKFIARMDADDICCKDRLYIQYNYLKNNPDIDVCGMNIKMFGEVGFFTIKEKMFPHNHQDICSYMLFDNPFAHPAVMFRKSIKGSIVKYDESVPKAQDYKLWYDLYMQGAKFHNINKIGLHYRISSQQISSLNATKQIETSNYVRRKMLEDYGIAKSEYDVNLHNEICNMCNVNIDLTSKLKWLEEIRIRLENKGDLTNIMDKLIFKYWISNCVYKGQLKMIFRYPNKNCRLYIDRYLLNNVVKFLF